MKALESLAKQNPLYLAAGVVLVVGALYYFSRRAVADVAAGVSATAGAAAETVSGVFTGNNVVTRETPYEGAGVLGTYGAVVNDVLGGVPQSVGESLGGWVYDLLHSDERP